MAIPKEDLHKLIECLPDRDQKTVFDFLQFLLNRSEKPSSWDAIDKAALDCEPLTREELRQLESQEGFISREEANREFKLQINLP